MSKLEQIDRNLNAYRFTYDSTLLDELRTVFTTELAGHFTDALLAGGRPLQLEMDTQQYKFTLMSYGPSPIMWVSNNCLDSYVLFARFFDALDIRREVNQLVDCAQGVVMYCGFFVVSNRLRRPLWHVDYVKGANGYTLITPLWEVESDHGKLLYQDEDQHVKDYCYTSNEAIIFGDEFTHTTQPYARTSQLRVLLSLTFGTDKVEYWPLLKETIGEQSEFLILPCGHQYGSCSCVDKRGP